MLISLFIIVYYCLVTFILSTTHRIKYRVKVGKSVKTGQNRETRAKKSDFLWEIVKKKGRGNTMAHYL